MLSPGLGRSVEDGVATACVSSKGVPGAYTILQLNGVSVTGAAAIPVVSPLRQEGTEDAVLHVKERHMLVHSHFQSRGS